MFPLPASLIACCRFALSEYVNAARLIPSTSNFSQYCTPNLTIPSPEVGAQLLLDTLDALEAGTLKRIPQDHDAATYAPMITRETGHIDWNHSGQDIQNLIRGLNPAPAAYTVYEGETLKIFSAERLEMPTEGDDCGMIVSVTKKGFAVACKDCCLLITELQAKGGKRMTADAYLRGHEIKTGVLLQ